MKIKSTNTNGATHRSGLRGSHARSRMLALTLAVAPFAAIERVEAACTPASPISNAIVTCTGTTANQNGAGYGTATDVGNTLNVVPGASVSGGTDGVVVNLGTVNNAGAITGTGQIGVHGLFNGAIVTNQSSSTIFGGTKGVFVEGGVSMVTNSGSILGRVAGVDLQHGGVTNNATGKISGETGMFLTNDGVDDRNDAVANAGSIIGTGIAAIRLLGGPANVSNTGSTSLISGSQFGIIANVSDVNLSQNAGMIQATNAGGVAIQALQGTANVNANSGTISADGFAIQAGTINVTGNAGTIQAGGANGTGIKSSSDATVENLSTGKILANGTNGFAIDAVSGTALVTNSGEISGDGVGIHSRFARVTNNARAMISSPGFAIDGVKGANVFNAGTISAGGIAINGETVDLDNRGTISATGASGQAISALTRANVANSGSIASDQGIAIILQQTGDLTLTNNRGGTISGITAIFSSDGVIGTNEGTIQGTAGTAILANGRIELTNSGRIEANGGNLKAINTTGNVAITNLSTGTISGGTGILAQGQGGVGSVITTSGTIIGTSGTAIKLSKADDVLTLLPGSHIVGVVDMGFGNDVVNASVVAPNTKVSSLTSVELPTFVNFTGKLNTTFSGGAFNGPSVTSGTQLATLDPTALAQTDRTLLDFTGGVSSLVQGRLNGVAPTANGAMMAMAYAPESATAAPFGKVPAMTHGWLDSAPITVWANSFGGQRSQDATDTTLRSTSTAWGAVLGLDRRLQPNWLAGAFIGGGSGGLSVDLNSQTVNTDYVAGGVYSRFEWAAQFFDFTVQGGSASNKSRRLVLNNFAAGGMETARASYNGWFISPEVAYGFRYAIGNGYVLTPTAQLRYVAGRFDGFNETGSAEGLSVGSRTLQDFEERGEVDLSRVTTFFGGERTLKSNIHGGVIAVQRAGNADINTVLLGQSLSFVTPGSRSAVGAVAGLGFDYHTSKDVAVFGAVEGMMMSDQSRVGTAKGGVRVAF